MKPSSLLLFLALNGCASAPAAPHRDASLALIEHHQFKAAAKAAPEWVEQALTTITAYEADLARK